MKLRETVLIPCTVSAGMFSTELAVEISLGAETVSLFVDKSLVVTRDDKTYLQVTFAGENGTPDKRTILLPSESFETGSRWLSVPEEALLAA